MSNIKSLPHPELSQLHPELHGMAASPGGLFDVPLNEMHQNVGRHVRFTEPSCGCEHELHEIICLQKNYRGDVVYRVQSIESDSPASNFGRCADPSKITFVS